MFVLYVCVYVCMYISFQISTMVHLKYHATEHRKVGLHMFLMMKHLDLVKNHIYDAVGLYPSPLLLPPTLLPYTTLIILFSFHALITP